MSLCIVGSCVLKSDKCVCLGAWLVGVSCGAVGGCAIDVGMSLRCV